MKKLFKIFYYFFIGASYVIKKMIRMFDYFFNGCSYLVTKRFFVTLMFILFSCALFVNEGYNEKLKSKKSNNDIIYEKGNPIIKYYNSKIINYNYKENSAVSDLISCYQEPVNINELPENVSIYITELNNLYNKSERYHSFFYQDLYTGFTVSYNENSPIYAASTIKAPAVIYIYEMASLGKIDLNERLIYTDRFYNGGSGIIKNKKTNINYSIEELIHYTIRYSDNIAYKMLMNRFNQTEILEFWKKLGTDVIFTNKNTIWGNNTVKDAAIYMKELYRFSKENNEYGTKLMQYFKNAEWKLITDKNGNFYTANKGGWLDSYFHDSAIVFDKNPYVLTIMSNTGGSDYNYLFKSTSKSIGKLHEEYWKYKVDKCSNILQY